MQGIGPLPSVPGYPKPESAAGRSGQSPPLPAPGQIIRAQVVEIRPDNTILLQFGANSLQARSELSFSPGQQLQLQLLATTPQIEFRLAGDSIGQLLSRPLSLAGEKIDLTTLLGVLRHNPNLLQSLRTDTLNTFTSLAALQQQLADQSAPANGSLLKTLVDGLGLALENLLARGDAENTRTTLKAALLELLARATTEKSPAETAQRSLATLEFFQLAQLQGEGSRQFILPLPLPFLEQGFMVVDQDEENHHKDGGYTEQDFRVTLYVRLTSLGDLQIDLLHNREGLLLRFLTESQEKADFLQAHADQLRASLTESPLISISFGTGAAEPKTELIRRLAPQDRQVFHTTA